MRNRKLTVITAVLLVAAMAGGASAWGLSPARMYLTFSGPVALPGVTLPTGSYVFERADSSNRADVVRVIDRRTKRIYLQALTIQVARPADLATGSAIVFEAETRPGSAPRIQAWFPADYPYGHKFLY